MSAKNSKLTVMIAICVTLVLISGIGAWVFINQRQIAQRDRQLQQQKEQQEEQRKFESQQNVSDQLNAEKEERTKALRCNYDPQNC